jgi:hypothetical protein
MEYAPVPVKCAPVPAPPPPRARRAFSAAFTPADLQLRALEARLPLVAVVISGAQRQRGPDGEVPDVRASERGGVGLGYYLPVQHGTRACVRACGVQCRVGV